MAKRLYETTDHAIMAGFGGNLLEWGEFLFRLDQFLIDLLENPRKTLAVLDRLTEIHLENLEKFLDAVEGYVQIVQLGDDLGSQQATLISPKLYREVFKPGPPKRSIGMSGSASRSSRPAAALSSARSTTSCPMSLRRMSSRCMMP
jgi:hypothetical protein